LFSSIKVRSSAPFCLAALAASLSAPFCLAALVARFSVPFCLAALAGYVRHVNFTICFSGSYFEFIGNPRFLFYITQSMLV